MNLEVGLVGYGWLHDHAFVFPLDAKVLPQPGKKQMYLPLSVCCLTSSSSAASAATSTA